MAEIIISKLKLVRGTNDQRKLVILDQGEPAYTTDTKRVFIGTGTLSGGVVVGSKVHAPLLNFFSLSTIAGEIGDLVSVNNKFYQLTAYNASAISSWADVSARIDTRFLSYNASNAITLNLSSLSASYINPSTIGDGLKIDAGILQLDYASESLEISGNSVAIKAGGITERDIASTALSSGLTGGSGLPIQLDIDTDYFVFDGNKLSLSSVPTFPLEFSDLDPSWFSDGLTYDSGAEVITAVIAGVDSSTIQLSSNEISVNPDMFGVGLNYDLGTDVVSLSEIGAASTREWPMIFVDVHGRVTSTQNAVYDIFKSDSSLSGFNYNDSLSGIFNGSPTGVWSPLDPTTSLITRFTALSSDNTTVVELSSAGFLVFEGNYQTRGGANDTINRFAIPIFRF